MTNNTERSWTDIVTDHEQKLEPWKEWLQLPATGYIWDLGAAGGSAALEAIIQLQDEPPRNLVVNQVETSLPLAVLGNTRERAYNQRGVAYRILNLPPLLAPFQRGQSVAVVIENLFTPFDEFGVPPQENELPRILAEDREIAFFRQIHEALVSGGICLITPNQLEKNHRLYDLLPLFFKPEGKFRGTHIWVPTQPNYETDKEGLPKNNDCYFLGIKR